MKYLLDFAIIVPVAFFLAILYTIVVAHWANNALLHSILFDVILFLSITIFYPSLWVDIIALRLLSSTTLWIALLILALAVLILPFIILLLVAVLEDKIPIEDDSIIFLHLPFQWYLSNRFGLYSEINELIFPLIWGSIQFTWTYSFIAILIGILLPVPTLTHILKFAESVTNRIAGLLRPDEWILFVTVSIISAILGKILEKLLNKIYNWWQDIDTQHAWFSRDLGGVVGPASRADVYDHYHGSGKSERLMMIQLWTCRIIAWVLLAYGILTIIRSLTNYSWFDIHIIGSGIIMFVLFAILKLYNPNYIS